MAFVKTVLPNLKVDNMILKHKFYLMGVEIVQVYWYEDRYRYVVNQLHSIEYRELVCEQQTSEQELQKMILQDIYDHPYGEQQLKTRCIRCSKWHGAPRKEYNLAPICNRCFTAMNDISVSDAFVWYEINPDGSKGSVIKQ